jgi:hypothetical protein
MGQEEQKEYIQYQPNAFVVTTTIIPRQQQHTFNMIQQQFDIILSRSLNMFGQDQFFYMKDIVSNALQ